MGSTFSSRLTGFIASLILTCAAYFLIAYPQFFHLSPQSTLLIILAFALLQALAQLIFFIHVWKEKGTYWNLVIFLSTLSILFIVIFFSIWIMNHLNSNMH